MNLNIPESVKKYLWDVDPESLTKSDHSDFIIERVLEYGDLDSLSWLLKNFDKANITKVLKESQKISPKTGYLYALYFGVPKEELICFQKPFTQKQNRF